MPRGTSDSRLTNKNEFMRYLNENERSVPCLSKLRDQYRKLHLRGDNFGFFMRNKHSAKFVSAYKTYWLKHSELYDTVYTSSPVNHLPPL